jgi:hypothetical protein
VYDKLETYSIGYKLEACSTVMGKKALFTLILSTFALIVPQVNAQNLMVSDSTLLYAQARGRNITIRFPSGSNCGTYSGKVNVGDTFLLNLAKEQQLIIEKSTPHDYTVQAPNGKYLEVIQRFPNNQNQYWTGNQSGNFKVKVVSVPQGMQIDIKFCAYTGEGEL